MKVSLFIPCLTDQFYPQTGMNTVRLLERLGVEVRYDQAQTCCGQPAFNTGYHEEARVLAMRFLDIFDTADYVVAPSGSCTSMVKVFYGDLLELPPAYKDRADALRPRIHELATFLVDVLGVDDVGASFHGRVSVHDSCHALRELGVRTQTRRLLSRVRGLELVEMDHADVCCGFGGTFAVKYADLSAAMGEQKIASIEAARVDAVTAVDSSCLMHIEGMLRRKGSRTQVLHLADILACTEG
jgi:L-lactate dehydrogenase complex protein LldE